MHTQAKDQWGSIVHIDDAKGSQPYFCPYCGVRMHAVHRDEKHSSYACYPHHEHTKKFCANRANTNIIRTINNPEEFFIHLFKETAQKKITRPEHHPFPPKKTFSPDIEFEDDDSISDIDTDEPTEKPFRSLQELWDYGLDSLHPDDPESHSNIVIFENWYKALFYTFTGGCRVIQASPDYLDENKKTIRFKCQWTVRSRTHDGTEPRWRYFYLQFKDKESLNIARKKLKWSKVVQPNGSLKPVFGYTSVLIAGNWIASSSQKYTFTANVTSKKQLYAIK